MRLVARASAAPQPLRRREIEKELRKVEGEDLSVRSQVRLLTYIDTVFLVPWTMLV
jgi:hypothetical protein